jgi:hypothetical protein
LSAADSFMSRLDILEWQVTDAVSQAGICDPVGHAIAALRHAMRIVYDKCSGNITSCMAAQLHKLAHVLERATQDASLDVDTILAWERSNRLGSDASTFVGGAFENGAPELAVRVRRRRRGRRGHRPDGGADTNSRPFMTQECELRQERDALATQLAVARDAAFRDHRRLQQLEDEARKEDSNTGFELSQLKRDLF